VWASSRLRIEVYRHRDQPLADSFIEGELILLSCALSIFAGFGQHAGLLVPFTFERVRDETIIGVDRHEAELGEIRVDLGAFDRATAQQGGSGYISKGRVSDPIGRFERPNT
jgi:hypothetical protein